MANRRPIQQAHERVFVEYFLTWFNRIHRSDFQVMSEPNPPEAVIRSSRTTRWIEVSTAFWNSAFAKDLYSYATLGEVHKPISPGPYYDMDESFTQNFVSVVKKKLEKESYIQYRDEYGPGYLVVPIKHPWFDRQTVKLMKKTWIACSVNDLGCFRSIFMAFHSCNEIKFSRWPVKIFPERGSTKQPNG